MLSTQWIDIQRNEYILKVATHKKNCYLHKKEREHNFSRHVKRREDWSFRNNGKFEREEGQGTTKIYDTVFFEKGWISFSEYICST